MESRARVALDISEAAEFARAFVQTISHNQIPVLLPNVLPATLERYKFEYDFILQKASNREVSLDQLDETSEIIFFTSGSTGTPKKIAKQLRHLLNEVRGIDKFFGHVSGPVFSTVSPQHIYGLLFSVLWPLYANRPIGNLPIKFSEQLLLVAEKHPEFVLVSSPSFLGRMDIQVQGCQLVISSGGLLSADMAERALSCLGIYPFEIFGSTETGGVAWRRQSAENKNGTWTLIENVRAGIDANSQLTIRSPFFAEPEIVMGDCGIILGDNQFILHGRSDRIAKIEGKRISLAEIETRLLESGLVKDAVAIEEQTYRDQISIVVVPAEGVEEGVLKRKLRLHLAPHFDAVALPKKIRVVDQLPLTTQSKLDMTALREMLDA